MIADALKFDIEAHARRVRTGNRFMLQALAGTVPPEAVERYLASLRFLFRATTHCLIRARERAGAAGLAELASFYAAKRREEQGHDRWAHRDLEVLTTRLPVDYVGMQVPAIEELVAFVERTIDADPRDYLAYMLWVEYFTVLVGADFVRLLVERNGIPIEALSAIVNHVELDVGHVEEGIETIDRFVDDPAHLEPMRAVVRTAASLFDLATDQMVDAAPEPARAVG